MNTHIFTNNRILGSIVNKFALVVLCSTSLSQAHDLTAETVNLASAVGYAAVGYTSMGVAKYFAKDAAETVCMIPKGTAQRVTALDFKLIMFSALKAGLATGTNAIPGIHLALPAIAGGASLQKTLFDAGSKYWTVDEFIRYMNDGLVAFDKMYGNTTVVAKEEIYDQSKFEALQELADTIYHEVLTLVGNPGPAIVIATHLLAGWRVSVFASDVSGAFSDQVAKQLPVMGKEPFNRVLQTTLGYTLACYLKPFIVVYVNQCVKLFGLPEITSEKLLAPTYHAASKGPFALEAAYKLKDAVVAFTPQAATLFVHTASTLWHFTFQNVATKKHKAA